MDFCIVVLTFIAAMAQTAISYRYDTEAEICAKLGPLKVIVVLRLLRLFRLVRMFRLITEHYQFKKAIRQRVSQVAGHDLVLSHFNLFKECHLFQNKRRYQMNGVDLDLTYVTKQIIAMSFPSQGILSFYRNCIREANAQTEKYEYA